MTSGDDGASEHVGASTCATHESRRPARACLMKPFISPPLMSRTASMWSCGPPALRSAVSWYGRWQLRVDGSGTQTVGTPFFIGIPSAPGYVPKYESNERFSCMITTMCRILWMPSSG